MLVPSATGYSMTSHDEVKLRKVGEPEFNSLPRGVHLIMVGDRPVFARRMGAHFIPLPQDEQERLRKKHIK